MHRCEGVSSSPHKRQRTAPIRDIGDLADSDLEEIFKRLPPIDRLLASEVCRRWKSISRKAWLDITRLDLSPIPGPNIAAVIKQCPNLRNVIALNKHFGLNELHILSLINLSSLKLYDCSALIQTFTSRIEDVFFSVFSGDLPSAQWEELVLHDFQFNIRHPGHEELLTFGVPTSLPPSLRRVQFLRTTWLSIENASDVGTCCGFQKLNTLRDFGFEGLTQLECLRLLVTLGSGLLPADALQNLRELELCVDLYQWPHLMNLRRLEVFFLHDNYFSRHLHARGLFPLVTKHPSLRIIAFTGVFRGEMDFPARVRYANGFHADPLPVLHIFVGKEASEKLRFPEFPSDAAKVYPISEPLPQFLEREDVAPIFEGVWIAEKIKETARNGTIFYDYERDIATSFRPIDT